MSMEKHGGAFYRNAREPGEFGDGVTVGAEPARGAIVTPKGIFIMGGGSLTLPDGAALETSLRDDIEQAIRVMRSAAPVQPVVTDEMVERLARSHYDQRMGRDGAFNDAPPGTRAAECNFARAALTAALSPNPQSVESWS